MKLMSTCTNRVRFEEVLSINFIVGGHFGRDKTFCKISNRFY